MAQARNWCFTLNNPDALLDFTTIKNVQYAIYSEEMGDQGTYHFQGYIQMNRPTRLSAMCNIIPRAHFEVQRAGNSDDARNYCAKSGDPSFLAGPYEFGTYLQQGARVDLMAVKAALDNGESDLAIAENHFSSWIRYHRSFAAYRLLKEPRRTTIENVIVVYGSPGTGKTYWATDHFENIYWAARPNNTAFYFENYRGESTILFDDFYGGYPRDFMLRLCQPYEMRLPFRGGECNCLATNIIMTTNKKPWLWWLDPQKREQDLSNFIRRVTKWIFFTAYKEYFESNDYSAFRNRIEQINLIA